jgi:hypothetical protein|tara:strand:- start:516 stop:803 length:288 start_codon:yes stop_codon:yes gene_type:complete
MNKERLKHFTDSITLEKNIKYKCEKLDRDKIRVRFYKTATTSSVFDMLVNREVYEDYIKPSNINSKVVEKLYNKVNEKHDKLDEEFETSMSSEIL